jgi:thiamine pyrophosphate-dependent acetolactate synthase large subunit-like protein
MWIRVFGGRHVGVARANPDFVRLGEAFGINALRVPPEGVGRAVREARERSGVWLIEVPFALGGSVNRVPWMP